MRNRLSSAPPLQAKATSQNTFARLRRRIPLLLQAPHSMPGTRRPLSWRRSSNVPWPVPRARSRFGNTKNLHACVQHAMRAKEGGTVFDHLGIVFRDLGVAGAFYRAVLAPLGIKLLE